MGASPGFGEDGNSFVNEFEIEVDGLEDKNIKIYVEIGPNILELLKTAINYNSTPTEIHNLLGGIAKIILAGVIERKKNE